MHSEQTFNTCRCGILRVQTSTKVGISTSSFSTQDTAISVCKNLSFQKYSVQLCSELKMICTLKNFS